MNILVLGGSYFFGLNFLKQAVKKYGAVTVFNRGTRSLGHIEGVTFITGDRHNTSDLKQLAGLEDEIVVVDFCAYARGDIASVYAVLGKKLKQYIFISTVDVYERGLNRLLKEDAPLEERTFPGEAGDYISGKVALEKEIVICAEASDTSYTVIRPGILYGPGNYAPREGIYFNWIVQAGQILHPEDATGEFQFVYVDDAARAVLNAVNNPEALNEAFNLVDGDIHTYETFATALQQAIPVAFEKVDIPVSMVYERNIPLPFPLTKEESNYYDGAKSRLLTGNYIPLAEGLRLCSKEIL